MSKYCIVTGYDYKQGAEDPDTGDYEETKVAVEDYVEADSLKIGERGILVFFKDKKIIQALPEGSWLKVTKLD
jgi:hypothetical protein